MEIKAPNQSDWSKVNEFLSQNLRADSEWSLAEEYPLAFCENNLPNMRIIKDEEEVLAHAVLKTHIIKSHYHLFRVGFIGSVVTDQKHRGRGYSSKIVKSCLRASQEQQCDLAILWTDLFNFYAKLGFEVAGSEVALQMDSSFEGPFTPSLKIIEGPKISPNALLRVYNRHSLKSARTVADIQKYLNIPQSRIFTAWSPVSNSLEAYCVMGKGADFVDYIHEWGGQVTALGTLVKHIVDQEKRTISLISPPQCSNLINSFESWGAQKFLGVLGMLKIVNPSAFCKKIKKGARALGYDSFVFEYQDDHYYFGNGDDIYKTDSGQDIVRLVFGPLKPEQIHSFAPKTLETLNEVFPIPFWVWGWDSI